MSINSNAVLKTILDALRYSGAGGALSPLTSGRGVIFMLHHVTPDEPVPFEPNRILKVTPAFLDSVIGLVRARGFDIVALDDVPERLAQGDDASKFACFTLDDGYRDNLQHAYPVFQKHNAPFTIYVPADYPEGRADLWWLTLERVIAQSGTVVLEMDGVIRRFACGTAADKNATFDTIYWWLRKLDEAAARRAVASLAEWSGFDAGALARRLLMTWDEIGTLARDPLVTIGAHTVGHWALAKLPANKARREIEDSMARVSQKLGKPCRHFSYPYGCENSAGPREFAMAVKAGAITAVTTRKGLLHSQHADRMTALPRLSLNGDFQRLRYIDVMLTGAPFALLDAAAKLKAALAKTRRRAAA